jgi:hypothetical protein
VTEDGTGQECLLLALVLQLSGLLARCLDDVLAAVPDAKDDHRFLVNFKEDAVNLGCNRSPARCGGRLGKLG